MRDLSIHGGAVDAALKAMPYLIAAHLNDKHLGDEERAELLKASEAIARWLKEEADAGR